MKIDLSTIDSESFMVHQHFVGEHECFLIQPQFIGTEWTPTNLHQRSVLVDKDGNVISASFKKFFNWDEKPDLCPPPKDLRGAKLMEKLDGSTLIFSRYKGKTIVRTRGTSDARKQENGYEVDYLLEKYPKFKAGLELSDFTAVSYVFEWLSPTNRIVINYGDEPDMALVAVIAHDDYSYYTQEELDFVAEFYDLRRPRSFSYNSIDEMKASVEAFRDQEGLCVYYNGDQNIRKVKGAQYLFLHRAKSEISSIEKVIDVYIDFFMTASFPSIPTYAEFFFYLSTKFDYEIATMAVGHASRICDAMKEVEKIMEALYSFAHTCSKMPRKDAAAKVLQAYGSTGRSSMIFKMLDGKPIVADDWKKLLYQVLK